MRGALRGGRGGKTARLLSRADESRRGSLQTPTKNLPPGGESAAEKSRRVSAKPGEYAVAYPAETRRGENDRRSAALSV
ncbi:hypothetical protein D3C72_1992830 [compost metagenome]